MSETITLDLFAGRLAAYEQRLRPALRREVTATALRAESAAVDFYDQRLKRRTGRLARTIAGVVDDTPTGFGFTLRGGGLGAGSEEVRYGRIQEEGGEVRPTGGRRFLAIPKGPALTPAGVPRFASPREVQGLRFVPIRGGAAGLLVKDAPGRGKAGTGARSDIWFLLVRRTRIRAKHFLRDGFARSQEGFAERLAAVASGAMGVARG